MVTLFASHEVSDYEKWKALMTSAMSQVSEEQGIQETKLYRTIDGGRVIGSHTFDTLENAKKHRAMMEDPEGQAMVVEHGVVHPTTIWIVEELDIL